jgi:hypothetical protein
MSWVEKDKMNVHHIFLCENEGCSKTHSNHNEGTFDCFGPNAQEDDEVRVGIDNIMEDGLPKCTECQLSLVYQRTEVLEGLEWL